MTHFQWLGMIALVAALLKVLVLASVRPITPVSSAFRHFTLALIIQNILEFSVSILVTARPTILDAFMYGVVTSIYVSGMAILGFSLLVSESLHRRRILVFFSLVAISLLVLQLTGNLILGFKVTPYTVVSVPGDLYFFMPIAILALVLWSVITLLVAVHSKPAIAKRCTVALKGLSFLLIVLASVALLKIGGFDASTGAFLPLATTLFLWILILEGRKDFVLFDEGIVLRWTISSIKWKTISNLALHMKNIEPNKWQEEIEGNLLKGALESAETKQDAAQLLGMARTTFQSKLKKSTIE